MTATKQPTLDPASVHQPAAVESGAQIGAGTPRRRRPVSEPAPVRVTPEAAVKRDGSVAEILG